MYSAIFPTLPAIVDGFDYTVRKLITRGAKEKKSYPSELDIKPYAIVMSVYNFAERLPETLEAMAEHRNSIVLVDDSSSDNTAEVAERYGVKVLRCLVNKKKTQEIRHAVRHLDKNIETVMCMDPDTRIVGYSDDGKHLFDKVLYDFQQSGADACAVRLLPKDEGNILSGLQILEYQKTMSIGRKSMGKESLVSGGFALFKRESLEEVLKKHSGDQTGEDYELSLLLQANGMDITYDDRFIVETDVPQTLRELYKQRVIWGIADMTVQHDFLFKYKRTLNSIYHHYIYNLGLNTLLQPFKVISMPYLLGSMANCIDNLAGLSYIPETAPFFIGDVTLAPEVFLGYMGFYIAMESFDLATNSLKNKRRYAPLIPLLPFYKMYTQIIAKSVGNLKGILKLAGGRKSRFKPTASLPKSDYENNPSAEESPAQNPEIPSLFRAEEIAAGGLISSISSMGEALANPGMKKWN